MYNIQVVVKNKTVVVSADPSALRRTEASVRVSTSIERAVLDM